MLVIGKQPCVFPEAGSKGVFQVKRVMGRSAKDSIVSARVGAWGSEKEWVGDDGEILTDVLGREAAMVKGVG